MSVSGYIFKSLKPLGDRVLIEKALPVRKSVGGIVLPDAAQSKTNWGTVKAVGPGLHLCIFVNEECNPLSKGIRGDDGKIIPMSVKPGLDSLIR